MAGYGTKRRAKINPKGFKKAFNFKQHQQDNHEQCQHSSQHTSGASSVPVSSRRHVISSGDDSSTCSSTIDIEGVLIFPSVQRLTASSPPLTILDSIPDLPGSNQDKKSDGFRSIGLGRRTGSKVSNLSSSAPSVLQTRAPYQSKKAQRNLQPALKTYRRKSDYAKQHAAMNNSAWERRQPMSTSRREGATFSRSRGRGRINAIDERQMLSYETRDADEHIIHAGSSNSFNLPAEVSPANRFVPIGYEEDTDIFSFNSDDYDICKKSMGEDIEQVQPVAKTVAKKPVTSSKNVTKTSSKGSTTKVKKVKQDLSCDHSTSHKTKHSGSSYSKADTCFDAAHGGIKQQPSLDSTEASTYMESIKSSESANYVRRKHKSDKYAVQSDKYDCGPLANGGDTDWFGYISTYVLSSCGAGSDTS